MIVCRPKWLCAGQKSKEFRWAHNHLGRHTIIDVCKHIIIDFWQHTFIGASTVIHHPLYELVVTALSGSYDDAANEEIDTHYRAYLEDLRQLSEENSEGANSQEVSRKIDVASLGELFFISNLIPHGYAFTVICAFRELYFLFCFSSATSWSLDRKKPEVVFC